jgi:hypothetical protein
MQMNLKSLGARTVKAVATVGVVGTLALAAATPSQARHGRIAAAGVGFAAGALLGAAAANAYEPAYYGPGYGAYAYAPDYGGPVYAPGAYAYEPGPGVYGVNPSSCATEGNYGQTDYWAC